MTQQTSDKLHIVIHELITESETSNDYDLHEKDYDFLVRTYIRFLPMAIDKFIKGGKEHNPDHDSPFVESCPVLSELEAESIDFIHYVHAALESIRNHRK